MVSAGGQHEPLDAHDLSPDPPVSKDFPCTMQTDLNQSMAGEKSTFPAVSGQCIERSTAVNAAGGGAGHSGHHAGLIAGQVQDEYKTTIGQVQGNYGTFTLVDRAPALHCEHAT